MIGSPRPTRRGAWPMRHGSATTLEVRGAHTFPWADPAAWSEPIRRLAVGLDPATPAERDTGPDVAAATSAASATPPDGAGGGAARWAVGRFRPLAEALSAHLRVHITAAAVPAGGLASGSAVAAAALVAGPGAAASGPRAVLAARPVWCFWTRRRPYLVHCARARSRCRCWLCGPARRARGRRTPGATALIAHAPARPRPMSMTSRRCTSGLPGGRAPPNARSTAGWIRSSKARAQASSDSQTSM